VTLCQEPFGLHCIPGLQLAGFDAPEDRAMDSDVRRNTATSYL